jgi:CheY-like chemotaxis protein
MKSHIRVLRVDDHPVIREGIVAVINGQPDMQVVAQASNGHEAVECFVRHGPDITLMNLTVAELSASVVHQVNEPLTSMLANAQAAKRWLAAEPPNLIKAIASIDRIARDARAAGRTIGRFSSQCHWIGTSHMLGSSRTKRTASLIRSGMLTAIRRGPILRHIPIWTRFFPPGNLSERSSS